MSNKDSRSGGKYSGNHTTLTPAATLICDIAHACESVTRISPGFLKAGLPSISGQRRVKIIDDEGNILLSVRDNTSHQEVHVYASDTQQAKLAIARGARNAGLHISFGKGGSEMRDYENFDAGLTDEELTEAYRQHRDRRGFSPDNNGRQGSAPRMIGTPRKAKHQQRFEGVRVN